MTLSLCLGELLKNNNNYNTIIFNSKNNLQYYSVLSL